ncbi:MAG: sigma-E processing peptidase SpoIIGA [Clostridia bacterium]|nr:sigma-E processing peptidase SpoIIGA [Clostridia bacterium]
MNTVIYADILVAINMIVNYFLLRACTSVTGADCKTVRMFLSSAVGGLFSLIIFIENIPPLINTAIKLAFLGGMVAVAFGFGTLRAFVKNCSAVLIANFIFAGIMFALSVFVAPEKAIYKNGIVYFDIDIVTLTVSAFVCYGILSLLTRFSRSRNPAESIYELTVTYNGKEVTGKALYDTGNTLRDSFSGRPVIIAEREFAEKLFGENEDITTQKSFRLIPYSTIKNGGALPAFLAEKITLKTPLKMARAEKIFIAVTDKKFISGDFCALLGTPVADAVDNDLNCRKERKLCLKNSLK